MTGNFKNLLLDRDGTIIKEQHYLSDPGQVHLLPGVGDALKMLCQNGWRLFVITNQSGIGRGFFSETQYLAVHARLTNILAEQGVTLIDAVHCPHTPNVDCPCRKPRIGLWKALQDKHHLDPAQTVTMGDKGSDIQFGLNAGISRNILVLSGHGQTEAEELGLPALHNSCDLLPHKPGWPYALARNLPAAGQWLLEHSDLFS